jgi:hypothetical protein
MQQTGEWWNFAVDKNHVLVHENTVDLHTSHRPKRKWVAIACHCETQPYTSNFTKPTMCDIHYHGLLHRSWIWFPLSSVCGAALDPLSACCHLFSSTVCFDNSSGRMQCCDEHISRYLTCMCNKDIRKLMVFHFHEAQNAVTTCLAVMLMFNSAALGV